MGQVGFEVGDAAFAMIDCAMWIVRAEGTDVVVGSGDADSVQAGVSNPAENGVDALVYEIPWIGPYGGIHAAIMAQDQCAVESGHGKQNWFDDSIDSVPGDRCRMRR